MSMLSCNFDSRKNKKNSINVVCVRVVLPSIKLLDYIML